MMQCPYDLDKTTEDYMRIDYNWESENPYYWANNMSFGNV